MSESPQLSSAVARGLRRAAVHLLRAGWEVAAAYGSVIEEVVRELRATDEPEDDGGPQRIPVD